MSFLVREAGVEPARPCEHRHLKPASLPIPPLAHLILFCAVAQRRTYIIITSHLCQHFFLFFSNNFLFLHLHILFTTGSLFSHQREVNKS